MKKGHLTRHNVFPAYAGVSRPPYQHQQAHQRLPRLRGGEPTREKAAVMLGQSSPPTRG